MTTHSPVIVFAVGALVVTGALAWCLRAVVLIGRAVVLPRRPA